MSRFKAHKISLSKLIETIPTDIFSKIGYATELTNIDRYAKTLHGHKMFYLLLYGILENDRLSQRTLEDTFNTPVFKLLCNINEYETVKFNSISERLSKINTDFFKIMYQSIYEEFSKFYNETEIERFSLKRVDSCIITDTSGRLSDGFKYNQSSKKVIKATATFDGIFSSHIDINTTPTYSSENIALSTAIINSEEENMGKKSIYVIDQGLSSAVKMDELSKKGIDFIGRVRVGRKHIIEKEFVLKENENKECIILSDQQVRLFSQKSSNRTDKETGRKTTEIESSFRLVVVQSKKDPSQQYWFITNNFKLTPLQVAECYRRRWDIEVFFRFMKQEMNMNHLVSLNKNGIEVMLYMTMIASMLVLIYKKINGIGYKTAKRRFLIELNEIIMSLIIKHCGGDPAMFFK